MYRNFYIENLVLPLYELEAGTGFFTFMVDLLYCFMSGNLVLSAFLLLTAAFLFLAVQLCTFLSAWEGESAWPVFRGTSMDFDLASAKTARPMAVRMMTVVQPSAAPMPPKDRSAYSAVLAQGINSRIRHYQRIFPCQSMVMLK